MIKAHFFEEGEYVSLKIQGHSGYKQGGELILCAAVSGIFYTLLGYLQNRYKDDLKVVKLKSGDVYIKCFHADREIFRMVCIGLIELSENYPYEIKVKNSIWDSCVCKKSL